jgi:hypothetical protein
LPAVTKTTLAGHGGGLSVQINPGGGKSWLFRYTHGGRERNMGLGPVDPGRLAESLEEARRKAAECRSLLKQGLDPLEVRSQREAAAVAAKIPTFAEAAEQFMAKRRDKWKNPKHIQQWALLTALRSSEGRGLL